MLIILFGPSGSGKTFAGNLIKKHYSFCFWDADEEITPDMQKAIKQKKIFTKKIRDEFTHKIIKKIQSFAKNNINIVISTALYKERNRKEIQTQFPKAAFVYVKTSCEIISSRIAHRQSPVGQEYAALIASEFEEPHLFHRNLLNDHDETSLLLQIKKILESIEG